VSERYLPEVGGSFVWFANVYRRYPPGAVFILTRKVPGGRETDATFPGVHTWRLTLERHPLLKPETLAVITKLVIAGLWTIRRRSIQVVHAAKLHPEGFVARLLWRATGVPYLVYVHGEELALFGDNTAYQKHRDRLRAVYRDAATVIVNSEFTKQQLLEFGGNLRNVVRISPGVDSSLFAPGDKDPVLVERLGLSGRSVLLSVGRLQKRKGHDHVLRALPEVLQQLPSLVYLVVGDGEERRSLEALAHELGVAHAVRFIGEVPTEDLPRYFNTCDIFVLANRTLPTGDFEGFGIVFLEASACGKPVIAGDSGGTADPVRDGWNGLRIDCSEPANIARAITALAFDRTRCARMGRNGRRMVENEYQWASIAERIRSLGQGAAS
jgi:phosphatidylinositol alpha-1,6-mannosyltransferase